MTIRWGILGTGQVAHLFASDLQLLPDADLVAVASRAQTRADAFGEEFDVPERYGSYEALAVESSADVVYVATPHTSHVRDATMALDAGKAVLCEKPLAINAKGAEQITSAARNHGQFLMEALWTRFLPVMADVRRLVCEDKVLGDLSLLQADIGAYQAFDADHRLFNPELGGGALLDLGVYPISLALDLFGRPTEIRSSAVLGETRVDEQCAAIFDYEDGPQAVWSASIRADTGRQCVIAGSDGRLHGQRAWWKGAPFAQVKGDGDKTIWARPYEGNGYQFEAAHVMRCLRDERAESPVMPLEDSLAILEITDSLRQEWGLEYPSES